MAPALSPGSDQIRIEHLRAHGIVGLHAHERKSPQDVLVTVVLDVDIRKAAQTDSIDGALNYSDVSRLILAHVAAAERFTIEALATDIAGICLSFPQVKQARVRLSKPAADRAAQAVAVEIERTADMLRLPALIGIGSNSAPVVNLKQAVTKLSTIGDPIAASTVYESPGIGPSADRYLNAVVRIDTCLPAAEIRRRLKKIEAEMGRTSDSHEIGPIPIDLDLCLLGTHVIRAKDVSIPDEDILVREYLAKACAEAMPDGVYPETNEPLADVAARLSGSMKLVPRTDVVLLRSVTTVAVGHVDRETGRYVPG